MTISASLKALEKLWATKRPALHRALRPGSTSTRLARLPGPLRTFYRWHDGLTDLHLAVEGVFGWPSLAKISRSKRELDHLEAQGFFDQWKPGSWWNERWLPVLQFNHEDFLCVDLAGSLGAGRGAVFLRRNSSPTREVLAPSFGCWLEAHVAVTAAGPDAGDDDAWLEHFESPRARRLRKAMSKGYPRRVEAIPAELPTGCAGS